MKSQAFVLVDIISDIFPLPGQLLKACRVRDSRNCSAYYPDSPSQKDSVARLFELADDVSKRSSVNKGVAEAVPLRTSFPPEKRPGGVRAINRLVQSLLTAR